MKSVLLTETRWERAKRALLPFFLIALLLSALASAYFAGDRIGRWLHDNQRCLDLYYVTICPSSAPNP